MPFNFGRQSQGAGVGRAEVTKLQGAFPPILARFWVSIVALTVASLTYTLVMTYWVGAKYPRGLPLFHGDKPFWDFTVFKERFHHFHTPSFWDTFNYPFTYPAPLGVVFAAFYKLPQPLKCYLALCSAALVVGMWLLGRELATRGISWWMAFGFAGTLLATSWPVGYLLNRANIEGFVAIILAAGLILLLRGHSWLGATLIGVAGATKLFPLLLLALLLSKRRYKEFGWGLVAAAVVTLASLEILGPTGREAERQISLGLHFFKDEWAAKLLWTEVGFDHSLFALAKVYIGQRPGFGRYSLVKPLKLYLLAVTATGLAMYFFRIRRLPMLNQALALSICAVLLPPVSFDYTLVHLLAPLGLLCMYATDAWRAGISVPGLGLSFACFVPVMTMDAFFTAHYRFAGQVRAILLSALLIVVLRFRYPWQLSDYAQIDT